MNRLDPRLAAAGAVVLVAGTVGAILLFGRLSYPAFADLREQPDPALPGTVAWLAWRDGESCVTVARASGAEAPRRLACGSDWSGPVTWTGDGLLTVQDHGGGPDTAVVLLDPATGREARRDPLDRPPPPDRGADPAVGPDGSHARTSSAGGFVRLYVTPPGGEERLVAATTGPRDYGWWSVGWSPDGRHLVVLDSAQRLLLVRRSDGLVRLLAEQAAEPAWGQWTPG